VIKSTEKGKTTANVLKEHDLENKAANHHRFSFDRLVLRSLRFWRLQLDQDKASIIESKAPTFDETFESEHKKRRPNLHSFECHLRPKCSTPLAR
jgi:hypothetical protein